jgi:hypothetical protein
MVAKKHVYETEVMALPPLYLVLGEVPVPDPSQHHNAIQKQWKLDPKMKGIVKRLIAYLKDEKYLA